MRLGFGGQKEKSQNVKVSLVRRRAWGREARAGGRLVLKVIGWVEVLGMWWVFGRERVYLGVAMVEAAQSTPRKMVGTIKNYFCSERDEKIIEVLFSYF